MNHAVHLVKAKVDKGTGFVVTDLVRVLDHLLNREAVTPKFAVRINIDKPRGR